jgi:thiol:disulfide interchange protein
MDAIKRFFGVLMLGTALWMVSPVIPSWLQMAGWAALGIGYGAFLLWTRPAGSMRGLGLVVVTLGLLQLVSVATGGIRWHPCRICAASQPRRGAPTSCASAPVPSWMQR